MKTHITVITLSILTVLIPGCAASPPPVQPTAVVALTSTTAPTSAPTNTNVTPGETPAPRATQPSTATGAAPTPNPTAEAFEGIYATTIAKEDLAGHQFTEDEICENAGTFTWTFSPGTFSIHQVGVPDCTVQHPNSSGSWKLTGDQIKFTDYQPRGCPADYIYQWHIDQDGLKFERADDACPIRSYVIASHPWVKQGSATRSPTATTAPPTPNPTLQALEGVYTTTITKDELTAHGIIGHDICENAGTFTLTLSTGNFRLRQVGVPDCTVLHPFTDGAWKVQGNQIAFSEYRQLDCPTDYTYKWQVDAASLKFERVDDPCALRTFILASHPWLRQGTPIPSEPTSTPTP